MVKLVMIGLGALAIIFAIILVVQHFRGQGGRAAPSPQPSSTPSRPKPAASVNRRSNWLEGIAGQAEGKTYHIGARDVTIGRKIGNYIQLIDDNVSRVHVKVRGTAQGVEVTDQKSNQGTMVNEDKLVANVPQMLQNGDKLKIGDNVFIFHAQADFGTNHGLTEQKVAGSAQNRATAAMGQLDWKSELSATLMKAGGDKEKAAEMMGLSPEVFEKMLEQAQKDG